MLGAGLAVVALAGWTLVAQRFVLARWAAESWLRERGVESLVEIEALDLSGFTGRIRLGDPRRPALEVERLEVDYSLDGPFSGRPFGVRTRAVRLVGPRLVARFANGKLTFGPLQPIIDEALKRPPTGPTPAVLIRQGHVVVATDAGPVAFAGDADLAKGEVTRLRGRITAMALRRGDSALVSSGGPIWGDTAHGVLTGGGVLDLTAASAPGLAVRGGALTLKLRTEYPRPHDGRIDGAGDVTIGLAGAQANGGGARAEGLDAKATIPSLRYDWDGRALSLTGGGLIETQADRLTGPSAAATVVRSTVRVSGLALTASRDGLTAFGETSGSGRAGRLTLGELPLTNLAVSGAGRFRSDHGGLALMIDGQGAAASALSPAQAQRLARSAPVLSGDPGYRQALARALVGARVDVPRLRATLSPGGVRLILMQPARVDAPSGARLTLAANPGAPFLNTGAGEVTGAARLTLAGGGLPGLSADVSSFSVRGRLTRADVFLIAALDYGPARDLKTAARARVSASPAGFQLVLAECAPLSIARLESGEKDVTGIETRICPTRSPLVDARRGAWTARGEARDGSALIELFDARARGAALTFVARGDANGLAGAEARITGGELVDIASERRFEPVRAIGTARLAGEVWQGELDLAAPAGPPLGRVSFRHDMAAGAGAARIDAPRLAFAKDGFQPASISPLAHLVAGAEGIATFHGDFAWTRQGLTSTGRLTTSGFAFVSPIGQARGLAADIALASLNPLATAPDQSLAIARIDALTPLTDATVRFDYAGDTLSLASAEATAAKGRVGLEAMRFAIGQTAPIKGVLTLRAVDLGELIANSTLADSLKLDAVVDGRLPFASDRAGFRFAEGRLYAIRPGRISISRAALSKVETGAPAGPPGQINAVQDIAYQAMEDLAFETLSADVASRPGGRLGMVFEIKGKHDPAKPEQARVSLTDLIRGKALGKRIPLPAGTPINLTLDTSLNFDELLAAFQDIWRSKQARSGAVQGR